MEFMEMERQLQDNVTKRLQAILEPEDLLFDEPMKDYTTFRVGGPAKWMAAPQDEQQLRVILKICRELQSSMLYSWTRQQSACQRQRF